MKDCPAISSEDYIFYKSVLARRNKASNSRPASTHKHAQKYLPPFSAYTLVSGTKKNNKKRLKNIYDTYKVIFNLSYSLPSIYTVKFKN